MAKKKAVHADRMVVTDTGLARTYSGSSPADSGIIVIPSQPERLPHIIHSVALVSKAIRRSRSKDDKQVQSEVVHFYQAEDREVTMSSGGPTGMLDHHTPFAKRCFDAIRTGEAAVFTAAADTLEAMEATLLNELDTLLECCGLFVDIASAKPGSEALQHAETQLASVLLERGSPSLHRQLAKLIAKAGKPASMSDHRKKLMECLPVHLRIHRCLHDCATELRKPPTKRQVQDRHERLFGCSIPDSTLSQELARMGFAWLPDGRQKLQQG